MADMQDFLTELLAPVSKTAPVRESATGAEGAGAAVVREAKADLRTRYRLNDTQAEFVIDRAVAAFVNDPYSDESFEAVVTREADAYADTLPEPLGREGSVRFFDALIEARGGQ